MEERYSFPSIAPLYPWYVPYIAECLARRYQVPFLKSLGWRDQGLNPGFPDHWRTLYPLDLYSHNQLLWFFLHLEYPKFLIIMTNTKPSSTTTWKQLLECIPNKPRAKCKVPWGALGLRKKRDNMKPAPLTYKRSPANANWQKPKKVNKFICKKKIKLTKCRIWFGLSRKERRNST